MRFDSAPCYERFRPGLAEAMDGRFYTIDYLDWLVRTGRAQFRAGADAAIVTEIRDYPGCKAIHGLVACGAPGSSPGRALDEIIGTLIPAAEAWARSLGCTQAIVESRPGWQRALRKNGYELHQIAVVKGL